MPDTDGDDEPGLTYRSNLSKSNALLYVFDHPEFDPDWRTNVPKYIRWTEDYFVHRTSGGEPAMAFGANVVGEQDGFNFKMDYLPSTVTLNGMPLDRQTDSSAAGWSSRELGGGDHAVTIRRTGRGQVRIASDEPAVLPPSRLRQ